MERAEVLNIHNSDELEKVIEKTLVDNEFRSEIIASGQRISLQNSWKSISESYNKLYSSI